MSRSRFVSSRGSVFDIAGAVQLAESLEVLVLRSCLSTWVSCGFPPGQISARCPQACERRGEIFSAATLASIGRRHSRQHLESVGPMRSSPTSPWRASGGGLCASPTIPWIYKNLNSSNFLETALLYMKNKNVVYLQHRDIVRNYNRKINFRPKP